MCPTEELTHCCVSPTALPQRVVAAANVPPRPAIGHQLNTPLSSASRTSGMICRYGFGGCAPKNRGALAYGC
eukprot:1156645-Pelagomonas_calceolata.AAC.6